MMSLAEEFLQHVEERLGSGLLSSVEVKRVCVGLHWTVVESLGVGMAHTYQNGLRCEVAGAGKLAGSSAWELAQRVLSKNTLDASVGWAALRSLMCDLEQGQPSKSVDIREWVMANGAGKRCSVVGRFPFTLSLRPYVGELLRFEMDPREGELPYTMEEELLPTCSINVITGASIINHTLERLLELGSGATNIVVGPTVPVSPLLLGRGATMVFGVKVVDADLLCKNVMEGAPGLRSLGGVGPVALRAT